MILLSYEIFFLSQWQHVWWAMGPKYPNKLLSSKQWAGKGLGHSVASGGVPNSGPLILLLISYLGQRGQEGRGEYLKKALKGKHSDYIRSVKNIKGKMRFGKRQ